MIHSRTQEVSSDMTRSEHHADSPDARVRNAKHVVAVLLQHHTGRDQAVSSKQLGEAIGLKPTTVRDMIPEIRREYDLPIASCSKGYYLISTQDEFLDQMERYTEQRETTRQHQQELAAAWNASDGTDGTDGP